ncbi:MAG: acyl-CoA dehydrogenase family protein [Sphingorhabdus sp.]
MDFSLTSEQAALADSVARFVERDYGFEARHKLVASANGYSDAHWATFAELGWLGAGLAEDQGGFGGGAIETALIAEQLGKGLVVEPFASTIMALQTLAAMDDFEGRAALIESVVVGETKLVLAHPGAGALGDLSAVSCVAQTHEDGYRLDGSIALVPGGPRADRFLISARAGDATGLFLVEGDTTGLTRRDYRTLDNGRASDLHLDGVSATRLGETDAMTAIMAGIDHGLITLCAEAVGAMEAALWMTRDYVKTRQQFGRTISEFQGVQFRMADMLVECELARSMLYQGLAAMGTPEQSRRIAAAKAMISEAGLFVGRQAIQLHGGIGMTEECAIGHYYKRLFVIAHLFGAPDVQVGRFAALA